MGIVIKKGRGWFGIRYHRYVNLVWDYRELFIIGARFDFPMDGFCIYLLGFRLFINYELVWRVLRKVKRND